MEMDREPLTPRQNRGDVDWAKARDDVDSTKRNDDVESVQKAMSTPVGTAPGEGRELAAGPPPLVRPYSQ
jgi:hypothetical protein